MRVADRQGKFQGKLNALQYIALQYLLMIESKEKVDIEEERMKYTLFASNPRFFKAFYEDELKESEEDLEWITPQTHEELEEILAQLEDLKGQESSDFLTK